MQGSEHETVVLQVVNTSRDLTQAQRDQRMSEETFPEGVDEMLSGCSNQEVFETWCKGGLLITGEKYFYTAKSSTRAGDLRR